MDTDVMPEIPWQTTNRNPPRNAAYPVVRV